LIRLTLKAGREASLLRRHPWLFSGAVASAQGDGSDGLAQVVDSGGRALASGAYSPESQIVARMWTFDDRVPDTKLFRERFAAARRWRDRILPPDTTGYRLVNSEGDRCPGVLVDRYGDAAVLELLTGGTQKWESALAETAREVFAPARLVVRRSGAERDRGVGRKLSAVSGQPSASQASPSQPTPETSLVPFVENNLKFFADIAGGQKTGFFLDQRENRARLRAVAEGRTVLNLFSYTGAFSVAALAGGARRAVDVDSSQAALALARSHRASNRLPVDDSDFVRADVFEDLRRRADAGEQWDVVVCDPPAFAKKRSDLARAARGYKDINRLAMKIVAPDGLILTCSCSGLLDSSLFQKIVFSASLEAGQPFALVARQGAGVDHPVSLDCPEGEYLKGLWLARVDG
jgi:23S rRNA (cytosine1962-C5)-methyltransferase